MFSKLNIYTYIMLHRPKFYPLEAAFSIVLMVLEINEWQKTKKNCVACFVFQLNGKASRSRGLKRFLSTHIIMHFIGSIFISPTQT